MKKYMVLLLGVILCWSFAACAGQESGSSASQLSSAQGGDEPSINDAESSINSADSVQETESTSTDTIIPEAEERKLKMTIDGQVMNATLYDTPAADALYEMLPLELTFEDFNGTEKISYLPEELPTEGEPDGYDPEVGDLCLYAPWGNLAIFYKDFGYSDSLVLLGHIDSGMDIITDMQSDFSVTLEKAEQ